MSESDFFEVFGIEPNDERLYKCALTHRSYIHQTKKNKREDQQERLEFFGDAVLKFVVSYYLMHKFPAMEEGMLTKIRARIISDRSLAELSLKLGLDQFVLISKSELANGGQKRPALLSDTFEAILGAMYLDKGPEYVQEWLSGVIEAHMSHYLKVDFIVDYKTFLQEIVQRFGEALPKYECVNMAGPEHSKLFYYEVNVLIKGQLFTANGQGQNKKTAQQMAARLCVELLRDKKIIIN